MNIIEKCLICESSQLRRMKKYKKDHLVKCIECGFVFSGILPTIVETNAVYSNYTRGNSLTNVSIQKNHDLAKKLLAVYGKNNNLSALKVLDIGCGDGYLLSTFLQLGCDVYGTEFDEESITICKNKGITMLDGGMLPCVSVDIKDSDKFDLIIMTEVIEHIQNPIDVISNAYNLMKNNGIMYFTTPNFNSLERRILGSDWGMIGYPEHLSYYTKSTMNKLLIENNMQQIYIQTINISIYRVVQFFNAKKTQNNTTNLNKISDPEQVSDNYQLMVSNSLLLTKLKAIINLFLNITGLGSSLSGVYRKQ